MARTRQAYRKPNTRYRTNGSAAYQPDYDGSAARTVRRAQQQPKPEPRPQVRPRRHVVRRPQVQVRQAGSFSLFGLIGFAAVSVCAALLLIANAKLMVLNDQTVALRAQLKALQAEQSSLLAQRDLAYDLEAIEEQLTADGTMVKPQPSQIVYLNASKPDSVVHFQPVEPGLDGLGEKILSFFRDLLS